MQNVLKRALRLLPGSVRKPIESLAVLLTRAGPTVASLPPNEARVLASQFRILSIDYGGARSLKEGRCLDRDGGPIPWYTYPAIAFLSAYDFSEATVFEYGAGNSTLWWAGRAAQVTTVESDEGWAEYVRSFLPVNCVLHLAADPARYARAVRLNPSNYDIIVVDGMNPDGLRLRCVEEALSCLRPGGMIVLDNSDWLPNSCAILRDAGLIEIPLVGLVPLNASAGATSVFLSRDFSFARNATLPVDGGVEQIWDVDALVRP
jgi:hypothetical protein